jgi:hypothetical protein
LIRRLFRRDRQVDKVARLLAELERACNDRRRSPARVAATVRFGR